MACGQGHVAYIADVADKPIQIRSNLAVVQDHSRQFADFTSYTIARPTPEVCATKLNTEALNALAETIRQRTGLRVLAFD